MSQAEESPKADTESGGALNALIDTIYPYRILLVPLVVLLATISGFIFSLGTALLVLAGGSLLLVIALFWGSVQSLTGEADLTLEEALSLAAPSAELEQKRAVLRALKDLDFEYRIGKISQADYDELSERYRAEAKRLLQQLAEQDTEARSKAEELFESLVAKSGSPTPKKPKKSAARGESDANEPSGKTSNAEGSSEPEAPKPARGPSRPCKACQARNPLSSTHCNNCHKEMFNSTEQLCPACPAVFPAEQEACPVCGVQVASERES